MVAPAERLVVHRDSVRTNGQTGADERAERAEGVCSSSCWRDGDVCRFDPELFRHPDWLGSSRFASTASRAMYYSGAYAPFGEAYAEAGTSDRSFTGQHQDTIPGSTAGLFIVALVLLAVIVTFAALHTYVTLPAAKF